MDSLLTAAAHALAGGDPLAALRHVALREDPPSLALRGIAMAQLGELALARALLKRAGRGFGARESLARARCAVADAEIALAERDLDPSTRTLDAARRVLEARGDHPNSMHARLVAIRRLLLLGRVDAAATALADVDRSAMPPRLEAIAELARADVALRGAYAQAARDSLDRAARAAERAGIPMLVAEVATSSAALSVPAARLVARGVPRDVRLDEVERLFASAAIIVDACRHVVRFHGKRVDLVRRPVVFALLRVLAEASPAPVSRETLIVRVFDVRRPNDSHRARLRVEIGRARRVLRDLVRLDATETGFAIAPVRAESIVVLAPPVDALDGTLLALLSDGRPWSTSALALAQGSSQRTVQRALATLEADGRVRSLGRARSRRWLAPPLTGFATSLLLPAGFASD